MIVYMIKMCCGDDTAFLKLALKFRKCTHPNFEVTYFEFRCC